MTDDTARKARSAALTTLERQMRRARYAEHLPEEERQQITIILGRGKDPSPAEVEEEAAEHESGDEEE